MAKQIKDSEQIIVGTSMNGAKKGEVIFYVSHKDVTSRPIPVGENAIGEFMIKMAKKREWCKAHNCKLNYSKWEQVVA